MKFLITGANFNNKGAQSMLFITIDEIRKRSKNAEVWFATVEFGDFQNYRFHPIYMNVLAQNIALQGKGYQLLQLKGKLKDCAKFILGKRQNLWQTSDLKVLMPQIDAVIDVSGFALGQKWSTASQQKYLNNIRLAKAYHKPIYLMPQSFGGFDYPKESRYLLTEIGELLKYPRIVFAREQQGEHALKEAFHLTNVMLSYDMVLQNQEIDPANIFKKPPTIKIPSVSEIGNVALIPNQQCFRHGDQEKTMALYCFAIEKLIEKGKIVYVFHHSKDDAECCRIVYEKFSKNQAVKLIEQDFSCFEYDAFIKQFEFILCSRFHGIVHAYRNAVPAIALGWEIKYQELAKAVGQETFAFDITAPTLDRSLLTQAIETMSSDFVQQSRCIAARLCAIQKHNCFDHIKELSDKLV